MVKVLAKNKRASFDYQILDKFQAGLVLNGHEVKSAREGNVNLKGAFVTLNQKGAWLTNAHISQYKHSDVSNFEPTRARKLLLNRGEVKKLTIAQQQGHILVPLAMIAAGSYIKLDIAIARSKKRGDKRQVIKKRQAEREISRRLKQK